MYNTKPFFCCGTWHETTLPMRSKYLRETSDYQTLVGKQPHSSMQSQAVLKRRQTMESIIKYLMDDEIGFAEI